MDPLLVAALVPVLTVVAVAIDTDRDRTSLAGKLLHAACAGVCVWLGATGGVPFSLALGVAGVSVWMMTPWSRSLRRPVRYDD